MRIDDAGPRTWLLAGVAGWALVAWLLALAGMGGQVEPLPPDPSLLQPLPQPRSTAAPRLGDVGQYSEIANRPLFTTDRRPQAFSLQGQGDVAESRAFDYILTGVLITPNLRLATIQPPDGSETLRVRVGEAPEPQPDWRLVIVNERNAVFEGPDGRRTLNLRVFDGVGGAAPTVVSGRPDQQATGEQPVQRPEPEQNGQVPAPLPTPTPTPSPQPPARSGAQPPTPEQAPSTQPMTDQAQMEAIRRRIQERRQQLRGDSPTKPPAQSP